MTAETNLKQCWVFFTKGRPPIRIQADNHLQACREFHSQNPDFHLRELLDIREAKVGRKTRVWLEDNNIVKW
jgi:hypothetical protein